MILVIYICNTSPIYNQNITHPILNRQSSNRQSLNLFFSKAKKKQDHRPCFYYIEWMFRLHTFRFFCRHGIRNFYNFYLFHTMDIHHLVYHPNIVHGCLLVLIPTQLYMQICHDGNHKHKLDYHIKTSSQHVYNSNKILLNQWLINRTFIDFKRTFFNTSAE